MKILTLTTYNVYNYGAALQAYALQTYLQCMGHDAVLINYQPEYLTRKYDYRWVNPESKLSRYAVTRIAYRVMKYLQRQTTMGRKRQFDRFIDSYLKQTREYRTLEKLCQNPPEADLYVRPNMERVLRSGTRSGFLSRIRNKGQKSIIRCQLLLRGYSPEGEKKNCRMPADI